MKSKCAMMVVLGVLTCLPSAQATTIRTGSGYGVYDGTSTSFVNCMTSMGLPSACQGFRQTSPILIGDTPYNVYQFDFANNGPATVYDVVNVGPVTASSSSPFSFELPVISTNIQDTGVFACGASVSDGQTVVLDSTNKTLTGLPCTEDSSAYGATITETAGTGEMTFTVDSDVADFVLFTTDGNLDRSPVGAPEPNSLALLALGLGPLGLLSRRRLGA